MANLNQQKQSSLTGLYRHGKQNTWGGEGSLVPIFEPGSAGGYIDVVKDFPWTLSPTWAKTSAPSVILKEFPVNESTIYRQTAFYTTGGLNGLVNTIASSQEPLAAYESLFPKSKSTGFRYNLPYFSEVNFSVTTPEWAALDGLEELGGVVKQGANVFAEGLGDLIGSAAGAVGKVAGGIYGTAYPKVGIMDRPRLWKEHAPRTIEIKFTLFNTQNPDDWKKNRDLCMLLVNQNLYNKRDFITGIPPVFYEILVPGQHYSYAACTTNITILNKGNMRTLKLNEQGVDNFIPTAIVPDAYEISMTLVDMVVPSKNLFQQINNQEVYSRLISNTDERNSFEKGIDVIKKEGVLGAVEGAIKQFL
jgi:hypothetical protein